MTTWAEVKASLGPAACDAIAELVAAAPPLDEQTYAELAVLLRHDRLADRQHTAATPDAA